MKSGFLHCDIIRQHMPLETEQYSIRNLIVCSGVMVQSYNNKEDFNEILIVTADAPFPGSMAVSCEETACL